MIRDGHVSPFSNNCDPFHVPNSSLDEDISTSSSAEELKRLLNLKKIKSVKILVRTSNWGVGHPIRSILWKSCLQMREGTEQRFTDEDYWSTVEEIFGSRDVNHLDGIGTSISNAEQAFSELLFNNYHLHERGIQACCRIVPAFLELRTDVSTCPMLYALTAILLHYMEEIEVFHCLERMVTAEINFLVGSRVANHGVKDALITLTKKHERAVYNKLNRLNFPDKDDFFAQWDKWIFSYLPFDHLVRVLDCYFCEGIKVFYRTCITCLTYCMKDIATNPTTGSALTTDGLGKAMELFLPGIDRTPKQFLAKCFKIRKFSSGAIMRIVNESVDRNMELVYAATPNVAENLDLFPEGPVFFPEVESHLINDTRIASVDEFSQIWGTLPIRSMLKGPKLVFTTEEHGCSLSTLYKLAQEYTPWLMLIKDGDDHVFGAYCSHALKERHIKGEFDMTQTFFGNGETFVFQLRPNFQTYKWIGSKLQSVDPDLTSVDRSLQLFIHADHECILIGGGTDIAAIHFDQNFQNGRSSPCPTFDSPSLSMNSDFTIKILEIYSIQEH